MANKPVESAMEEWAGKQLKARRRKTILGLVLVIAALLLAGFFLLRWNMSLRGEKEQITNQTEQMSRQIDNLKKLVDSYREKSVEQKEPEEESIIVEPDPVIVDITIREQLSDIQELVTSEYNYTNAASFTNNKVATVIRWDVTLPFTSKSLVILYDGRIKAGMDLSRAAITINEDTRTITVALPACKITSHEVFDKSVQVVAEEQSWFNELTTDDYLKLITSETVTMEQRAIDQGLLTNADRQARKIVETILKQLPGMDTYKLVIQ